MTTGQAMWTNHRERWTQAPGYAAVFHGVVYIAGRLQLVGGFRTTVKHPNGSTRAAHRATTTEPIIVDLGRARLTSGVAHVDLDPPSTAPMCPGPPSSHPDARPTPAVARAPRSLSPCCHAASGPLFHGSTGRRASRHV